MSITVQLHQIFMSGARKDSIKAFCIGTLLLYLLHWVILFEQIREHGGFVDFEIEDDGSFVPLGIAAMEDFPSSSDYRVEKIIHQTWKTDKIPKRFQKWLVTWKANHPDWTYMLWTDESAKKLIKAKYPTFLDMFLSYSENIRRADALRYFVLYEFGGVYADLDVESLKPIDPMAKKYACFLAQEPYEHPILDSNFEHLVINALMGCRKGHPFMKMVIEQLPYFSHMWNVLDSTGPHFLTSMFRQYSDMHQLPPAHDNGTYLAPAEYFFPTIDPAKHFWMQYQCKRYKSLSAKQQQACLQLKLIRSQGNEFKFAFTDHHWIHTYLNLRVSLKAPTDIRLLVDNVIIYGGAV